MGMGQALTEEMIWKDGLLMNPGLLEYRSPSSVESPEVEPIIVESIDPEGPFGAKECSSHDRFWYSPMELADFRYDVSELERLSHERVRALMVCSTRIVESKGIVLLGYTAEYQSEAGWQRLGGISYLGLGFGIPFVGKK